MVTLLLPQAPWPCGQPGATESQVMPFNFHGQVKHFLMPPSLIGFSQVEYFIVQQMDMSSSNFWANFMKLFLVHEFHAQS